MVELTLMVNPLERTARLRGVHALAAGDLCTLTVSGVPGALPGLQLALYRDASMESLVASVAEFSPVPGHSRDRVGTLDLGAAEMEEWFEDEVAAARRKASRRISSLGSLPSAASLSDESSDGLPPRASPDMPAEGWLVLFDAERTWVSCPVSVLLRKVEVAAGGVEPVLTLLSMKVDKVPAASAGNVPVFVAGGGIADSGVPAAPDASLSAPGRPADAKAVGDALRGGYTEWEVVPDGVRLVFADGGWYPYQGALDIGQRRGDADSTELEWSGAGQDVPFRIVAVRRRITPTKTSHLENDGDGTAPFVLSTDERLAAMASTGGKLYGAAAYPAWSPDIGYDGDGTVVSYAGRLWESYGTSDSGDRPTEHPELFREKTIGELKQDALSSAQKAAVNSGVTAAKVAAWDGYAAQIAGKAGVADVNAALAQKASLVDLSYALVTPGEWEFSGGVEGFHVVGLVFDDSLNEWIATWESDDESQSGDASFAGTGSEMSLTFSAAGGTWTATRASLPGHLLDRAVNLVSPTVIATTEWTWADGETGTPVFSSGQWTVQNASFDTYDGPVAGSASDTEITFAKTDTKSFYYSTTDYDYDTGDQVFVFNVGEGGEEVRAKSKWSDGYYMNIVESLEYDGVEYVFAYPVMEYDTGSTFSGTGTVAEHVVSLVTTYGPAITLAMPHAVPGRVRDLIARIDLSQAAGAPPVAFSGGSFEAVDGEMPELVKGVNLLSFTETAAGVFAVAYKEVKPVVQGGS